MVKALKQFRIVNADGKVHAKGVVLPSGRTLHETLGAMPQQIRTQNLEAVRIIESEYGRTVELIEDEQAIREYYFERIKDISGQSGIGVVVRGGVFPSGVAMHEWIPSGAQSVNIYDNAKQAQETHGHNGATLMKFVDKDGLPPIEE